MSTARSPSGTTALAQVVLDGQVVLWRSTVACPTGHSQNCLHSCCEPACNAGGSRNHGLVENEHTVLAGFSASAGMGSTTGCS